MTPRRRRAASLLVGFILIGQRSTGSPRCGAIRSRVI
jgi:hypothetical protein